MGEMLAIQISHNNQVMRLASGMFADDHVLYRGHITGFEQRREMADALTGKTTVSFSSIEIHNSDEIYDADLIAGAADIRIGDEDQSFAAMTPVLNDAQVALTRRDDKHISLTILDGQARGKGRQRAIFDTSGEGFGTLLPEIWGAVKQFPLQVLDGDAKLKWGCAGPVTISKVLADKTNVTADATITGNATTVASFDDAPDNNIFVDAVGFGGELAGSILKALLTRTAHVCQGRPVAGTSTKITLDEHADNADTITGKEIKLFRESGTTDTRTISAYDDLTRIATVSAWSSVPTVDDLYSIKASTHIGGFKLSQIDSAGFNALDSALPYTFGLAVTGDEQAIAVQDKLLAPLLCHMGPRRDGKVQLKRLQPAGGDSVMNITRIIDIERSPMPVFWHVEAKYRADVTGGHWRSTVAQKANIKYQWPQAIAKSIDVPVKERNGAKKAAQHWLTCFGKPTEILTMTVDHDLAQLELGDVVRVIDHRYQLVNGKLGVVVSMTDKLNDHDVIGVWVVM